MTARPEHDAVAILLSAHLRRTAPRLAVLESLLASDGPLTQEQITARIGPRGPNRVTVYRILESFVAAGVVRQAFLRDRAQHYELAHCCPRHRVHPHFTCTQCGKTCCLHEVDLPMPTAPVNGFLVSRQRVEWEGLCPACRQSHAAD
jgi:Fur family transcriptional regulator, ferric uptake regulator